MATEPSLDGIRKAARDNREFLHRTPTVRSETLGRLAGCELFLKLENLQKTGSFKPRGALHNMRSLPEADRRRGVVTISAGNHAQGVAFAGRILGIPATVVMPESASPPKVEAARGYGARVVLHGDVRAAFAKLEEIRREEGLAYVHAFDDPRTVEGQGTLGLEILEEVPDAHAVVAGIGGGGLISGIAVAVKSLRPGTRMIGVEPEGAATMRDSFRAGRPMRLERIDTIADGLAPPFVGDLNFALCRDRLEAVVVVSDDEIRGAVRLLLERCKVLAEPAGAAALAALLARRAGIPPGARVVCVVSGGNVDRRRLAEILA
ncbi:MAG: pyridoxal-phosphate dependent enzyme [Acidobacteria bacterium]|nr:pyridoxal-phosphate dependent enzyme [Acidobacteriota bacterium]